MMATMHAVTCVRVIDVYLGTLSKREQSRLDNKAWIFIV